MFVFKLYGKCYFCGVVVRKASVCHAASSDKATIAHVPPIGGWLLWNGYLKFQENYTNQKCCWFEKAFILSKYNCCGFISNFDLGRWFLLKTAVAKQATVSSNFIPPAFTYLFA